MKQLPFIVVLVLSSGLLLWNFSRYDVVHAAGDAHGTRGSGQESSDGSGDVRTALRPRPSDGEPRPIDSVRRGGLDLLMGNAQAEGTRVALAAVHPDTEEASEATEQDSAQDESSNQADATRVVLRLPGGEVRAEGQTVNGLKHGSWVEWWSVDQRLSEGSYEYGQREGPWTYWHENTGEVMERGAYEDDLAEGPWVSKYPDGALRRTVSFVDGLRDGPIHEWGNDGTLLVQGNYASGEPEGPWVESHPDGTPRTETNYLNGMRHGSHRAWYTNGQLMEQGEYRFGRREGRWLFYDVNGQLKPLRSGYYEQGYRNRP